MKLRWLGTAGFELSFSSGSILIDPYFSRLSLTKLAFGRVISTYDPEIGILHKADCILITHAHIDHLLDTPVIARHDRCPVYGSENTCRILASLGIADDQIKELSPGKTVQVLDGQVTPYLGKHVYIPAFGPRKLPKAVRPPVTARDYAMDIVQSLHIQFPELSILTEPGGPLAIQNPVDILFLSPLHLRKQLRDILLSIRPKFVIASHYDEYWMPLSSGPKGMPKPRLGWPPIRRVNSTDFTHQVQKILPGTPVLFPKVFEEIDPAQFIP